ncbi:sulfotransferase family protein [Salinimicrobium sediminis]|nr:sulfotransferase family protein [Salinimicrobium sediminis]
MKSKVFVIGFHKTGTTSLETALENLGYRVYGGDKNLLKFDDSKDLKEYIHRALQDWDAVQDMPWPLFYKELHDLYPDAKFIMTLRETEGWINSVVRHWGSIRVPLHRKIYNVPCAEGFEETYKRIYTGHNKKVLDFFQNKPNFLVMEQGKNFDYKTLCDFLSLGIPPEEFPHSRKNTRLRAKIKLYRDLRSFYWNKKNNWK